MIDFELLWSATWRGILIAIPIWCVYIVIKVKIIDYLDNRR